MFGEFQIFYFVKPIMQSKTTNSQKFGILWVTFMYILILRQYLRVA